MTDYLVLPTPGRNPRSLLAASVLFAVLLCGTIAATAQNAALPPIVTATAALLPGPHQLAIKLNIKSGYHINSNPASDVYAVPTEVTVEKLTGVTWGKPAYPPGVLKKFAFSDKPVSVYTGSVVITVPLTLAGGVKAAALHGQVRYQACDDRHCLLPAIAKFGVQPSGGTSATESAVAVASPANEGEAGRLRRLAAAPLWLQLMLVFAGGLLLNLTPCVYPMIPITIGYFGAQSEGRLSRTFALGVFYVLGLAAVYSSLGVTAALTGSLFGSALQSPFVLGLVALVLLALSLSMMGLFTIAPPQFVMARSGAKKGLWGALGMGAMLGLVAAPCVGPVVGALLTYVGTSRSVPLGFGLFFTLSLGLGLPYLLLGTFSGSIKSLPRSGAWLERSKKLFALPLLGAALFYGYLALKPAAAAPPQASSFAHQLQKQYNVHGLPTIVFLGADGRERTDLRAGEELTKPLFLQKLAAVPSIATSARPGWNDAAPSAIAQAAANHQPVVLDFRADWCLPCKHLESAIFRQPEVLQAAHGTVLLTVDLTR